MQSIVLTDYRNLVCLDDPFIRDGPLLGASDILNLTDRLLSELTSVREKDRLIEMYGTPRRALYAKLISRAPLPFPSGYLASLDRLLAHERALIPAFDPGSLPRISEQFPDCRWFSSGARAALWRGDITRLNVDAVVNAGNETLLGCFIPFHACIDNAIHRSAGPRLRNDAATIMKVQGVSEEAGQAKITRA